MGFLETKTKTRFRFKEKVLRARLALTQSTLAQYLTKRLSRGDYRLPNPCLINLISRAAYEVDDYWRIVKILHKRLSKFSEKKWIGSYKALILLDHLLLHGPLRAAEEFEDDVHIIKEMKTFQYVDHKGFDWGFSVRKKSEHVLKLIEDGSFLKHERDTSRKVKIDRIEGEKSFICWSSTTNKNWKILEDECYNSRCIYHPGPSRYQYHENNTEVDLVDKKKIRVIACNHLIGGQSKDHNSPEEEICHGQESIPSHWISFEEELLSSCLNYEKGMVSSMGSSPSTLFSHEYELILNPCLNGGENEYPN